MDGLVEDRQWCSSSYLAFRYVVEPDRAWADSPRPKWPRISTANQIAVSNAQGIDGALRGLMADACNEAVGSVGVLLSGGIDSAILAAYLPTGTRAFTIRYEAPGAVDESPLARRYALEKGLDLTVVEVGWSDHEQVAERLMWHKGAPLHAVEVGLHKAAQVAASMGIESLVVGNGADSTFGGMDKLLARDWTFDEFVDRYTFVQPETALAAPVSMRPEYEKYRHGEFIDTMGFLKRTHGIGIVQSFENALEAAGVRCVAPYEALRLDGLLDIQRVRDGQPKYMLQEIFRKLYPALDPPRKIPFARPMDVWLAEWAGPRHPDFCEALKIDDFTGEQRWLLWALDRFLHQLDEESER